MDNYLALLGRDMGWLFVGVTFGLVIAVVGVVVAMYGLRRDQED